MHQKAHGSVVHNEWVFVLLMFFKLYVYTSHILFLYDISKQKKEENAT